MAGRRRRLEHSKLLSFVTCGRKSILKEQAQVGTPGFSRIVYINEDAARETEGLRYPTNYISTTKYTLANFIPKSLFEQFRRVANFYFLVTGCLAFTPLAPYTAVSAIVPLLFVIAATMAKEGIEDLRRKQQDHEINNRKVDVLLNGHLVQTVWKNLKVGDVVKVSKDNYFPADLLLLSSSFEEGICYVETMNLDGETNLKLKQALDITQESAVEQFYAITRCEDPNANLYGFVGTLEFNGQNYPLSIQQLLLRDSKLRNTEYIYGAVIFTGHDTKAMQNATNSPSKRSKIEWKMDRIIYLLLFFLVVISLIGSIFFGISTEADLLPNGKMIRWYLRPENANFFFDPHRVAIASFYHLLTVLMLYSYFIPISLYISIEIVKILQAFFINNDVHLFDEEANKQSRARTSNLNEELGQVDTILSDKTGTLTANMMEFIKCSIAGVSYGVGITEVEEALSRRKQALLVDDVTDDAVKAQNDQGRRVKGFSFRDPHIMDGNWIYQPFSDTIQWFFRLLAICHTCIPEVDEKTGQVSYEAESPDEAAFVVSARELGFEFYRRTQTTITLRERHPITKATTTITFRLLHILEFSSTRKRMSVIVRDENGKILLLCKGADSVMFGRLVANGRVYEKATKDHIAKYADAGLRTLVLAIREIPEEEYQRFNKIFMEAKTSVSADRDEKIEAAAETIERKLILLGATAVEDKLQKGVPECIDKLAKSGIKIWVLTGDKMETAINIGFACNLLRKGMTQIIIALDTPEILALEKTNDQDLISKASKDSIHGQIQNGKQQIKLAARGESFALIIDGKSLYYALLDDLKSEFWSLAVNCVSVICCRSSPKQKALVTRLVKQETQKVVLGIGDGANDVGMLQEANIGVGISGAEGMQAVMASDIAIPKFRFLEQLLLVHGHWCYRRISLMICYFFYKNITFGVTLFLFEAAASFSGQPAYNDWFMSLYNVIFTSLPVIALGVFDQDLSAKLCLKFPRLYQEGVQNMLFTWRNIIGWMLNGIINAILIFFLCTNAVKLQAFRRDGQVAGLEVLGPIMCTCVIWVVNIQMALTLNYFTVIQHIVIWGSIAIWYVFLIAYGALDVRYSTSAFMVFIEKLAPSPSYWTITLLVVLITLIPNFCYFALRSVFFPTLSDIIKLERRQEESEAENAVLVEMSDIEQVGVSHYPDDQIASKFKHLPHFDQLNELLANKFKHLPDSD